LQQCLPFTVLKLLKFSSTRWHQEYFVATALTVYGIETSHSCSCLSVIILVATALTVYGIETSKLQAYHKYQ
ncbi:hypothetical protein, partial [Veillonella sp.]|uniref:hypothetical protein n=1 Tax=Veillonella sp. TaxID=1926307 RepID=UPI00257F139A